MPIHEITALLPQPKRQEPAGETPVNGPSTFTIASSGHVEQVPTTPARYNRAIV